MLYKEVLLHTHTPPHPITLTLTHLQKNDGKNLTSFFKSFCTLNYTKIGTKIEPKLEIKSEHKATFAPCAHFLTLSQL